MTDPGLVSITAWRAEPGNPAARTFFYGGTARKTT